LTNTIRLVSNGKAIEETIGVPTTNPVTVLINNVSVKPPLRLTQRRSLSDQPDYSGRAGYRGRSAAGDGGA
jgi:hypothetical protein